MALLEIEQKFRAPEGIAERIAALGAAPGGTHVESDHYFNAPDRDFATTNEAFRIRVIDGVGRFTYKGPRQPGPAKTRKEIEVPLAGDWTAAKALVESLGYRFVAVVDKQRTLWTLSRGGFELVISQDEVKSVGSHVEVEIVAGDLQKAAAEGVLLNVCRELGLNDPEPRSYLRMLLESQCML